MEVKEKRVKQEPRFVKRGLETTANPDKHDLQKGFEEACLDASHLTSVLCQLQLWTVVIRLINTKLSEVFGYSDHNLW